MDTTNNKVFEIFCKKADGTLEELRVDIFNREFDYTGNLAEEELADRYEKDIAEFEVSEAFFSHYFHLLDGLYRGSFYVEEGDYAARQQERERNAQEKRARPLLDRNLVWQALRCELDDETLSRVRSYDYRLPKDDYYDFPLLLEKLHAVMRGDLSVSYFHSWCVVVMRCLEDCMTTKSRKLKALYYALGDAFDGLAFMDADLSDEERQKECREFIAFLKYQDHLIGNVKTHSNAPFTTNDVVTYVAFAFTLNDGNEELYRVCVADLAHKTINYLFVPEFDYDERINYYILSEAEFDELPSAYADGFALDVTMPADYALNGRK